MRTDPATQLLAAVVLSAGMVAGSAAHAANCVVSYDKLKQALKESVEASGGPKNGGFGNNEWAVVEARDGTICAVAYSGNTLGDQWPASRAIAAEKANTADGMSTAKFALSTANLYASSQPGGYLFGGVSTNPPDPAVLYAGEPPTYGTENDPLVGKHLGGVVVFGGGLGLYDPSGIVGALGVSGDTSCADQNVAWRIRKALGLDKVPNGPTPKKNDAAIYDIGANGKSASGFGHPSCGRGEERIGEEIGAAVAPEHAHERAEAPRDAR